MAEKVKLSKDGNSIDFVQSESIPTSVKKFRQSPEIEGFYRFIYENDLQREAFEIMDRIVTERKAKKAASRKELKAAEALVKAEIKAEAAKVAAKSEVKAAPVKAATTKPAATAKPAAPKATTAKASDKASKLNGKSGSKPAKAAPAGKKPVNKVAKKPAGKKK
ncbi:MAG: hypothetical protein V4736_03240 [Bdellovibrionota bacterium]